MSNDDQLMKVLGERNTEKASELLRDLSARHGYGIGIALLAAWQHGLEVKHIPDDGGVRPLPAEEGCPYVFVHVPVREFRSNTPELIKRNIMNQDADPALFVYHEDGLIGTFSFARHEEVGLTEEDLREILRSLAGQRVLVKANIDNRQIQFKDLDVKRRIEASGTDVYVRVDREPLSRPGTPDSFARRSPITLPRPHDRPEVWDYILKSLQHRFACNYCSVQTLCPKEVTINSAIPGRPAETPDRPATVRNYQMGFTFAPVGDPRKVCHFLAWDFPHISDLVMNMEPQTYSFGDLIGLVEGINRSINSYYAVHAPGTDPIRISGGCNHWAGNSIYHQHYQFMCLDHLPLVAAAERSQPLWTYQGVDVRKMGEAWAAPALLISSAGAGGNDQVMRVADKIAREWRVLSTRDDTSFGNKIVIRDHTQNIFVTAGPDGRLLAIFIPRVRDRASTSSQGGITKANAGVLEMMGYFVIDSRSDFDALDRMAPEERGAIGRAWLKDLSPDEDAIAEFESNVRICLDSNIEHMERRIDELTLRDMRDWRSKAQDILRRIQGPRRSDGNNPKGENAPEFDERQRDHLYRELTWALLDLATSGDYEGPDS